MGLPWIAATERHDQVTGALDDGALLVAGTAWLFSRADMDGRLDVLVVDEAGQYSLADPIASGTAARNLILVGDPRQLPQVAQGAHPPGVAVSALEQVLQGRATMPPDRGLFLPVTRRLHPDIAAFISEVAYEGRLEAAAHCARRRVEGVWPWSEARLCCVPTPHEGNGRTSPEEAAAVAAIVRDLLGGRVRDERGRTRQITLDDILVVAPFNAHVQRLLGALQVQVVVIGPAPGAGYPSRRSRGRRSGMVLEMAQCVTVSRLGAVPPRAAVRHPPGGGVEGVGAVVVGKGPHDRVAVSVSPQRAQGDGHQSPADPPSPPLRVHGDGIELSGGAIRGVSGGPNPRESRDASLGCRHPPTVRGREGEVAHPAPHQGRVRPPLGQEAHEAEIPGGDIDLRDAPGVRRPRRADPEVGQRHSRHPLLRSQAPGRRDRDGTALALIRHPRAYGWSPCAKGPAAIGGSARRRAPHPGPGARQPVALLAAVCPTSASAADGRPATAHAT